MTDFTRGFRLHLRHGQVLDGAMFPSGRCLVLDDPHFGLASAAASEEELLRGYPEARIEWPAEDAAAAPTPPSLTEGLREQYAAAIYERNNPPLRWAEAHPDDVLAYGSDADAALTVRDRELEQARAEVTRLHEGEEPYVHEHAGATPGQWIWLWNRATPGQWIWLWNRATPEERLDMAARIKDAFGLASACFMGGHEARLDEQQARITRLEAELGAAQGAYQGAWTAGHRGIEATEERAHEAEKRRDELAAARDRVRALAADLDDPTWRAPGTEIAARIRLALDGEPAPAAEKQPAPAPEEKRERPTPFECAPGNRCNACAVCWR
jgi:hypothetical protein